MDVTPVRVIGTSGPDLEDFPHFLCFEVDAGDRYPAVAGMRSLRFRLPFAGRSPHR
jgi:hypothetical protein